MSRSARRASLLIVVLALAGGLAPAPPEDPDPVIALAREQLKTIELALRDMDMMLSGGNLNISDPKFGVWGARKLEALRAAKVGKDEMVAALTEHFDRMKKNEEHVNKAHVGGEATRLDIRDAHYRRLEAEIWLNREKAR